ncbi:MAG: UDP-N-acetylmuramoyl-L-alanine--D-glutamate ligase [Candidatus Saccharimonadales bacterium]
MKIAIIGYGLEGQAAYNYWDDGHGITICDQNAELELPAGVSAQLGDDYLANLGEFDIIVRSPHVHPAQLVAAAGEAILSKVTSNTNEFLRVCPTKNIIGVTGTKGKGTTSTLIAELLRAGGKTVHLGGNIGVPALDLLRAGIKPTDFVVLELSSFQLIDLRSSPQMAVCLMVAPEHLDWHDDFEEYVAAKQQLFIHQSESDIAVYYAADETSTSVADASVGQLLPYYEAPGAQVLNDAVVIDDQVICQTDELQLLGRHNWQNVCAALTVTWQYTQDLAATRAVLTSFAGLPYRLEFVRDLDGVRYYNDSFGTTPETAIVAMQAFAEPKVIILGGSDKGASYGDLAQVVIASHVRCAVLIGEQAWRIQASLEAAGFTDFILGGETMKDIVEHAQKSAQPGDVVLLSTACASFDLFINYKDRGAQFTSTVQELV